jgi:quercetin dioxygenase-like cupin family protein
MPIVVVDALKEIERLPGWRGRFFHTPHLTFAHYNFTAGAFIHEHAHPEEEVYEVIEGELELTIDGEMHFARPGIVAIVPANVLHAVRARTDGRVIIVDHPARPQFGA